MMLAPGIRAAAAENKHLWDPGCSVPVARGPAERPETVRPAGKVRLPRLLCDLRVLTRRLASSASGQGCLGPGRRVILPGQADARAGAASAPAFWLRQ